MSKRIDYTGERDRRKGRNSPDTLLQPEPDRETARKVAAKIWARKLKTRKHKPRSAQPLKVYTAEEIAAWQKERKT